MGVVILILSVDKNATFLQRSIRITGRLPYIEIRKTVKKYADKIQLRHLITFLKLDNENGIEKYAEIPFLTIYFFLSIHLLTPLKGQLLTIMTPHLGLVSIQISDLFSLDVLIFAKQDVNKNMPLLRCNYRLKMALCKSCASCK